MERKTPLPPSWHTDYITIIASYVCAKWKANNKNHIMKNISHLLYYWHNGEETHHCSIVDVLTPHAVREESHISHRFTTNLVLTYSQNTPKALAQCCVVRTILVLLWVLNNMQCDSTIYWPVYGWWKQLLLKSWSESSIIAHIYSWYYTLWIMKISYLSPQNCRFSLYVHKPHQKM